MITTGVLGGRWRASVTPWGGIEPWNGEPACQWHVAADDRWHSPEHEPAVRQHRLEGTAVVETKVRIPDGDAVQRIYSVADHGGLTVIEVENASPLPIAVAFTRGDVLSVRPSAAAIEGIELPAGSVVFPVGHHATIAVALAHTPATLTALPQPLPPMTGVVRGWLAIVERASRLLLPEPALNERVVAERCELALAGPVHPDDDPVGFLLGVGQLVRMGEQADPWLPDVAHALEAAAKGGPRDWALAAAFDATDRLLATAGEARARRDLAALRLRVGGAGELPSVPPADGSRFLAWVEARLADAEGRVLPHGLPDPWLGANFETYGVPTGATSAVSFAVRWHGERPAVLWEQQGDIRELTAPMVAPQWRSTDVKGEALWPAPPGSAAPTSFG